MIAVYRTLVGMRCPICKVPQPVLNLRATYAGGVGGIASHNDVACISCDVRLRLALRHSAAETWALRILTGVIQLAFVIVLFLAFWLPVFTVFGPWGLLGLPCYVVIASLVGAWCEGKVWPWTLRIEQV